MSAANSARFVLTAAAGLMVGGADAAPTLDDATRMVGSARAAVAEIALLSGTENFSIDALRSTLRESRGEQPYTDFDSSAKIVEFANSGATTTAQLLNFSLAWAALEVNWVFATLLGDEEASSLLMGESNRLINHEIQYMSNVERGRGSFNSVYTRIEANRRALTLRRVASEMNLIAMIPDAMDPEGFIRQRMQVAYNRLTNAADFLVSAGEAFAVY